MVKATPRPIYPMEKPGTHCIGGWVVPRAGLDGCGKCRLSAIRSPDRPARSESLYRLSYPGPQPWILAITIKKCNKITTLRACGGFAFYSKQQDFTSVEHPHTSKYRLSAVCADAMKTVCIILCTSVYSSLAARTNIRDLP